MFLHQSWVQVAKLSWAHWLGHFQNLFKISENQVRTIGGDNHLIHFFLPFIHLALHGYQGNCFTRKFTMWPYALRAKWQRMVKRRQHICCCPLKVSTEGEIIQLWFQVDNILFVFQGLSIVYSQDIMSVSRKFYFHCQPNTKHRMN